MRTTQTSQSPSDTKLLSTIPWHLKYYHQINNFSLKYLGKYWISQHIGAPYPRVIPHFAKNLKKSFYRITAEQGEGVSAFFNKTGVAEFAMRHQGICTFRIGRQLCLYQGNNRPLFNDISLCPSTLPAKKICGNFMGTYPYNDPVRKQKRQPILQVLTTVKSLQHLQPFAQKYALNFIENSLNQALNLEDFCINIVAYIDSYLPGVIDVSHRPLTSYLASSEYGAMMSDFLKFSQEALEGKSNGHLAKKHSRLITDLVRSIITDNFEAIAAASESNLFKQYCKIFQTDFTQKNIANLPDSCLKELAMIIITLFETSALSLYWLICYIEENSDIKQKVIAEANNPLNLQQSSYIELIIMENLRLAGANPTAASRQVTKQTQIQYCGVNITIPKGIMLWLDRRTANQDISVFPCPHKFSTENVSAILKSDNESFFSVLGNKRYEINSFSMVNTFSNPRKCPGRFFSIMIQSSIIRAIYGNYKICCQETDCSNLRKYSFMPKPDNNATISLTKH